MFKSLFKKGNDTDGSKPTVRGNLPKPKDLPTPIGRDLVVVRGMDPDLVWRLKCVLLPQDGKKGPFNIRIFNPAALQQKKVTVRNYHSLDDHPDLIMFEGWYDQKNMRGQVSEKEKPATTPRAA